MWIFFWWETFYLACKAKQQCGWFYSNVNPCFFLWWTLLQVYVRKQKYYLLYLGSNGNTVDISANHSQAAPIHRQMFCFLTNNIMSLFKFRDFLSWEEQRHPGGPICSALETLMHILQRIAQLRQQKLVEVAACTLFNTLKETLHKGTSHLTQSVTCWILEVFVFNSCNNREMASDKSAFCLDRLIQDELLTMKNLLSALTIRISVASCISPFQ